MQIMQMKHIIALVYQKTFGNVYWCILGIIRYSLLYLKQKKTVITSKFNICWENLNVNQVNTIFKISEKVQTKRPLPLKYKVFEKNIFLIQKPWKI